MKTTRRTIRTYLTGYFLLACYLFLCFPIGGWANDGSKQIQNLKQIQNPKERLDSAWSLLNLYTEKDEEVILLEEIVKIADEEQSKNDLLEAYHRLARHTYNTLESTPDTLLYYLNKLKGLNLTDQRSKSIITDVTSYICYAYIFNDLAGEALNITNQFLEEAEKNRDDYAMLTANEMLGTLYAHVSQHREALSYYNQAYEIFKRDKATNKDAGMQLQLEIADVCFHTKNYKELRRISLDMKSNMDGYTRTNYGFYDHNHALIEASLAICCIEEGNMTEALKHIENGKNFQDFNDGYTTMLQKYSESLYLEKNGELEKAWELVKDELYDSQGTFYILFKVDLMEKMGKWKEANNYRKELLNYNIDRTNVLLSTQLNEIRTKFDVNNLEMKNIQMSRQQAVFQSRIYGAILLLTILLGLHLLIRYNKTKKEKKSIELANKEQTAFLQNMSHEIRTPLNAICGFSQLLSTPDLRDILTDEEYREYGEIIQSNTDLLTTLVTDILVSSDLESGKYQLNIHKCSANNICRRAINTVKTRCPNHIKLYYTSDIPENYCFESDEMRCQQILINYLTNAIKHTDKGEIHLHVSQHEKKNFITFSVTDTGTGVPADKAETIFGRFEKLDTFKQGTGLGLNICRKLATLMKGEVFLDTTYTSGARFIFNHPCVA